LQADKQKGMTKTTVIASPYILQADKQKEMTKTIVIARSAATKRSSAARSVRVSAVTVCSAAFLAKDRRNNL
jgi:hypothetical protein